MRDDLIERAYNQYESLKVINSVYDWKLRLRHVPDEKVIEYFRKNPKEITLQELTHALYPDIHDDESAMAHGWKDLVDYQVTIKDMKKKLEELQKWRKNG